MNENIVPDSKYFCPEHGCKKIIVATNDEKHILLCQECYKENSTIEEVRHKFISNLTRQKDIYFFVLFSMAYTYIGLIFEVINLFNSLNIFTPKIQIIIKLFGAFSLVYFTDKLLRNKFKRIDFSDKK